jgi:hypothetical protein
VCVRQAAFLKLNHSDGVDNSPEMALDEGLQMLEPHVKSAASNGRRVCEMLTRSQSGNYVGPSGVRRHGDEEGRLPESSGQG